MTVCIGPSRLNAAPWNRQVPPPRASYRKSRACLHDPRRHFHRTGTPLFRLDARLLDPSGPFGEILAHEGREFPGRAGKGVEPDARQTLLDRRIGNDPSQLSIETLDHRLGRVAGAKMAFQGIRSNEGSPASVMDGMSGRSGLRSLVVTARARTFPAFACGEPSAKSTNIIARRPVITSLMACGELRYGTWTRSRPAIRFSVAPATRPIAFVLA